MSNTVVPISNGLSIVPRRLTMLPGDLESFETKGSRIPALWGLLTSGTMTFEDDYTILLTVPATQQGGYALQAGTGQVSLVLDERMLGTGDVGLVMYVANLTDNIALIASPTQVEAFHNGSSIDTFSHTLAAGDIIAIEATGARFNCKLNNEIFAYFLWPDGAQYPCFYDVSIITTLPAENPSLVPPILEGDWRPSSPITWTILPDEGELDGSASGTTPPIVGPTVRWTAPNLPTTYALTAQLGDSDFQLANAQIDVPTLRILGPRTITVDPLEELRFRSNYDTAQKHDLLTWSADDGDFDADRRGYFTAAEPPGDDIIRVTATLDAVVQYDEITVTVRTVFWPPNICAVQPGEELDLYTNLTDPVWTENGGSIAGTGSDVVWTAPELIGQVIRLSVTGTEGTLYQDVTVLEVLPVDFNLPYGEDVGAEMLVEIADDARTVWARQKSEAGFVPESFELRISNASSDEYEDIKVFHNRYFPTQRSFFIVDQAQNRRVVVRADSKLKVEVAGECNFDIAFRCVKTSCPLI